MASRIGSDGLRRFLQEELEEDSNATLESARQHLQDLCDFGSGDAIGQQQQWVVELEELIDVHHEHASLRDLLATRQS